MEVTRAVVYQTKNPRGHWFTSTLICVEETQVHSVQKKIMKAASQTSLWPKLAFTLG